MAGFGEGLGQVIGASMGAEDLGRGLDSINGTAGAFGGKVAPYEGFGASFLPMTGQAVNGVSDKAGTTKGYDQFMADYQQSPGVKYQIQQGEEAQNESAASTGQLLSGTNQRALAGVRQGIAATGANTAYDEYLKGSSTQFGQLETALGNMFQAIGVGTTATGQEAGVTTGQMNNQAAMAQAQAKNDASKGSGIGSMFSGLLGTAASF